MRFACGLFTPSTVSTQSALKFECWKSMRHEWLGGHRGATSLCFCGCFLLAAARLAFFLSTQIASVFAVGYLSGHVLIPLPLHFETQDQVLMAKPTRATRTRHDVTWHMTHLVSRSPAAIQVPATAKQIPTQASYCVVLFAFRKTSFDLRDRSANTVKQLWNIYG